ncbi:hypothetical protein N5P37_011666 [Trichoderma harzianum]|uniref:Uncharacterized protein n=1 Tax=Trichoderma harzianum CBS 226.95 TaxID=983964 RepID=A0A2T3ZXK4_TRIHA|nr:hypothetical protein M431DRAFT_486545 [Trichoderma harzianum CBS 226.95]KAK0755792.1 hypothetical protein N5P37_011666 [Trichoderma harzianum]PTB49544.1 hypothetical protein M431DRAFT_486545 [Trichoderma harzianum CBS 226.95]
MTNINLIKVLRLVFRRCSATFPSRQLTQSSSMLIPLDASHLIMMDELESNQLLGGDNGEPVQKKQHHKKSGRLILLTSLLVNLFLTCFIVIYLICQNYTPRTSYEKGFHTDLGPIKSKIGLIQQRFTGGEEIDHNGNFVKDQRGSEYIGSPSPEVDAVWDRLLLGMSAAFEFNSVPI